MQRAAIAHRAAVVAAIALSGLVSACATDHAIAPPPPPSADAAVYRLGSGDQLRVIVFGEDRLTGEYHVGDNGDIVLPLVGPIKAAGQTTTQVADAAAAAFRTGGYLTSPRVAVEVLAFRPFYVNGEVAKPGAYPFIPGLTLGQAISTAGGYTYRAQKGVVRITKSGQVRDQAYRIDRGTTMMVLPGDTITVPERHF